MRIKINLLYLILLIVLLAVGCQKTSYTVKYPSEVNKAETYFIAGEQAFKDENYKEAIDQYLKSVDIYIGMNGGYNSEIGALYYVIGESYAKINNYEMAIIYFENSLSILEKDLEEKDLLFSTYSYLSIMYTKILSSNLEKALDFGKKAEIFAQSYFGIESSQMAEANKNLGNIYGDMENFERANTYWKKAMQFYGIDSNECAKIYIEMAQMYEIQENYDDEEKTLNDALSIFKKNDASAWVASTYSDLAVFYGKRKDHNTAITHYKLALDTYNECEIAGYSAAFCHYNMGIEYFSVSELDNFAEEMRRAYNVIQETGVASELDSLVSTRAKESLRVYYNEYYEGDKTSGFDAWFEEFISQ